MSRIIIVSQRKGWFPDEYYTLAYMNDKEAGGALCREGVDYITLHNIYVMPMYRRFGVGTELVLDILKRAKVQNKILLTGGVTQEGRELFLGMQEKGLIKLVEPTEERFHINQA